MPPSHETRPFGIRFVSEDKHYQVQLRRNTFLFSRLAPYQSWEVFRQEAQSVWRVFQRLTVAPSPVSLGLRYVNKISFPETEKIERYLRLYVTVPDSLEGGPQPVTGGHLRIQMPIGDPAGLLVVQQVLLPSEAQGMNTIALDNDFRFGALGLSEMEIWDRFEQPGDLRTITSSTSLLKSFWRHTSSMAMRAIRSTNRDLFSGHSHSGTSSIKHRNWREPSNDGWRIQSVLERSASSYEKSVLDSAFLHIEINFTRLEEDLQRLPLLHASIAEEGEERPSDAELLRLHSCFSKSLELRASEWKVSFQRQTAALRSSSLHPVMRERIFRF